MEISVLSLKKFLTIMRISFHFLQFSISFHFLQFPISFKPPFSVKVFSKMTIKSKKGIVLEKKRLIL